MSCEYGSRRKQNSVDFINTNDIGVLCFLFGLEGGLCRLLDLIPDAIKKIAALDPNKGNGDEIFKGLLKKVARTSYGLVIDELTNQISTTQLCGSEPPTPTEDINFSDVFVFIAELVPILEKFFTVNEILTGDSTRILDKIVNTWLRGKWFENCECKPQDTEEPPPPPPDAPSQPPPFSPLPDCSDGTKRTRNLQLTFIDPSTRKPHFVCYSTGSCGGLTITSRYGFTKILNENGILIWVANEFVSTKDDVFSTYICNPTTLYCYLTYNCLITFPFPMWYRQGNNPWIPFNGDPSIFDGLPFEPCPSSFTEEPPDSFCGLYPDDPLCLPPDEENCEVANYSVAVKVDCSTRIRKPVARTLRTNGVNESITVQEFSLCGERIAKQVGLLQCVSVKSGCTNPNSPNYDPLANVDDGSCISCESLSSAVESFVIYLAPQYINFGSYSRPYQLQDLYRANSKFQNTDTYKNNLICRPQLEIWFEEAWNTYFYREPVYGCTDDSAINYDPNATEDDDSCQY